MSNEKHLEHKPHLRAFSEAEALAKKYLSFWTDICNIESYTSDKAGVDAVGEYFIRHAREQGYTVDVWHEDVSGDALTLIMYIIFSRRCYRMASKILARY